MMDNKLFLEYTGRVACIVILLMATQLSALGQGSYILQPNTPSKDTIAFPYAEYAYVNSYSFNRDSADSIRYKELMKAFPRMSSEERLAIATELDTLYTIFFMGRERSVLKNGKIVKTAQKIQTLSAEALDTLVSIFRIPTDTIIEPDVNCMPIYRDALVFFDKQHQVIGAVDICFQCYLIRHAPHRNRYWETRHQKLVALKHFFEYILGHPIEKRK